MPITPKIFRSVLPRRLARLIGGLAVCVAMSAASARGREASVAATNPAADLTATIDSQLAASWAAAGVDPAEEIADEAFIRRVSLDLAAESQRWRNVRPS
jgi:hypothetical protein